MTRHRKRVKPARDGDCYRQFHRVIDGAIRDTFAMHPDYLTVKGSRQNTARRSICKRVTGAILGWVEQSTQGRSGQEPAPELELADPPAVNIHDDALRTRRRRRANTPAAGGPSGREAHP